MKGITLLAIILTIYTRLFVFTPPKVRDKFTDDIPHSYANFGIVPYGSTIMGRMYFSKSNADACKEYDEPIDLTGDPDPDISPFILAYRGNCSFVTKVRNIQKWGGRIAVIINNRALEYPDRITMVDDGTGNDVTIPSILISKEDGDTLKTFHASTSLNNETIILGLNFKIEAPDDRVEYDLYYSLGDIKAMNILKDLSEYHKRLGKNVYFTPHFVISEINVDQSDCLLNGKYCMSVTDTSTIRSTGKELLEEAIRQKCIYKNTIDEDNANSFFDYIIKILDICYGSYSEICSKKAQKELHLSTKEIDTCINASYITLNGNKENIILSEENSAWKKSRIMYYPALVVNNRTIRGKLEGSSVFTTICNGFNVTPSNCHNDYIPEASGISVFSLLLMIILIGMVATGIVYWSIRKNRKNMYENIDFIINARITQYQSLKDQKPVPSA